MITSHHMTKQLASERAADLQREAAARGGTSDRATRTRLRRVLKLESRSHAAAIGRLAR